MSRYIGGFLIVLLLLVMEFFIITRYYKNDSDELVSKIDSLEKQIKDLSIKKDSIRLVIDTIENQIVTNNNYYEEISNTIISQPSDSDSAFIRYYICRFAESRGFNLQ